MWCRAILGLLVVLITCHKEIHAGRICQNGGTLDVVRNECICTAYYHGLNCEFSFTHNNPCASLSTVNILSDTDGMHRLGNDELCEESSKCIKFSEINTDWYRIESPAGNFLISQCPTGHQACGSETPYMYILIDEAPEDNSNLILSKAKAAIYIPSAGLSSRCYDPSRDSYPVRILKCSSEVTLYYMQPLPSSLTHYCIGNKSRCEGGLTSIDGSGFEPCSGAQCIPRLIKNSVAPVLRLEYHRQLHNIRYDASFYCNVYSAFETNSSSAIGVLYLIEFELTYRNGTSVTISDPRCRWRDERIDDGKNKTFECRSENVLTRNSNLYGGTLILRVQARCNTSSSDYNSVKITSNSHGFFFKHWFQDKTSVIKPDTPVTLCIDSKNIPVLDTVQFSISVGRQQIMPNDRVYVAAVRRDGNQSLSCAFDMENIRFKNKIICQDIVLYNNDPDGRIPLGLTSDEQISVVKVNISFTSSAAGLYTMHPDKTAYLQKIYDVELKVDLSQRQNNVSTYMHAFADRIKFADGSYHSSERIHEPGYYRLLRHKLLPYEIQGRFEQNSFPSGNAIFQHSTFTNVAIRYVYDIIHIYMNGDRIAYRLVQKNLPTGVSNPLKRKPDGWPFGITMERNDYALRIRFDLYETVLYVCGFNFDGQCGANRTVGVNINEFPNYKCKGNLFGLDLVLFPGFYDTKESVEGLIFGQHLDPITELSEIILSSEYKLLTIQTVQPTKVLSICSCSEKNDKDDKKPIINCFVSIENIKTDERESPTISPITKLDAEMRNSTQLETLVNDICPGNCSNRGSCLSGECACNDGFWGSSCELEIAQKELIPIEIRLLQRNLMCSAENCSGAYLMVKPFLKSADCICNIMVKSRMNFTAPTVFISGNIVMCELKKLHEWLVKELMMYSLIQIKVTAPTWESNNTIDLLVHQTRCSGEPVQCNETSMTCQVEKSGKPRSLNSKVSDESEGINVCPPSVSTIPTGSAVTPALHLSLLLIPTLLSVTAIGLANK